MRVAFATGLARARCLNYLASGSNARGARHQNPGVSVVKQDLVAWVQSRTLRLQVGMFLGIALATGCGDASCPAGTVQMGSYCRAEQGSSGTVDAAVPAASGDEASGTRAAPGTAAVPTAVDNLPSSMGAASPLPGSGDAGVAIASSPAGTYPCAGLSGRNICDGAVLHHCEASASTAQETCTNATFCQFGVSTGHCAECNPGSFRCTGAALERCDDTGTFVSSETCSSEGLCNATAGACTDNACMPDTLVCAAKGTLQKCNADGSMLSDVEDCGPNMCDAQNKRCFACVPNSTSCSNDTFVECSADGSTTNEKPCSEGLSECMTGSCTASGCQTTPKPSGTTCKAGKCDGNGACAGCLSNADCEGAITGECYTGICAQGACQSMPKASDTACGTNKKCNGSGRCVDCITDADCSPKGECYAASCQGGSCRDTPKSSSSTCNGGRVCDGLGGCVDCTLTHTNFCKADEVCSGTSCVKKPCGDGNITFPEFCDPEHPLYTGGRRYCDSETCQVLDTVYTIAGTPGMACWPGSGFFFAPTGACTAECSANPTACSQTQRTTLPKSAQCVKFTTWDTNGNASGTFSACAIQCTTDSDCGGGTLRCVQITKPGTGEVLNRVCGYNPF